MFWNDKWGCGWFWKDSETITLQNYFEASPGVWRTHCEFFEWSEVPFMFAGI